uniref:DNA cross-link repair 1A protein n=1 Tax=Geotrypetes seraphini TaxID=260995 RepID=A0A6P8R9E9_GEOSA|nr:DNA cross-link repair 1A protein [Geotrypetes seraphini]
MSEYGLVEDDIWEYKSIRKQKSAHNPVPSLIQAGKKSNDGECTSRKSGNRKRKRALGNNEKHEKSVFEPKINLNKQEDNLLSSSQESVTSSAKQNRPYGSKVSPQNVRPIYEGYCPSCQMPFSLLLVQTPRWHVSECLDTPGCTDKECPDGLHCTSTIPSHYKRYTHFLLARSRSGDQWAGSEMYSPDKKSFSSDAAKSEYFTAFKDETTGNLNQTLSSPKGPTRIHWQGKNLKQSTLQFTQSVDTKEHFDLSQTQGIKIGGKALERFCESIPILDESSSSSEISFSPLCSDDDEISEGGKLRRSRKRLFSVGKSEEEQSETEGDRCTVVSKLNELQKGRGHGCLSPGGGHFTPLEKDLGNSNMLSEQLFRNDARSPSGSSAYATKLPEHHPAAELPFHVDPQKIKEEPDWPEFSSPVSGTSWSNSKDPGASDCLSPTWVSSNMVLSVKAEDEKDTIFYSLQNDVSEKQKISKDGFNRSLSGTGGKLFEGILPSTFNTSLSHSTEKVKPPFFQSTSVNSQDVPLKRLSSTPGPNVSVKRISTKGLKQMDIGVFFGLKPKVKEEKEETNLVLPKQVTSSVAAPNAKGPRQKKRKAEGSVGGPETATGTWDISGVPGGQRGWKKRFRKSSAIEGREKKQCPFYKKIAGTDFVVDAFQYGEIEGCTAYFLTHFHSDHYGGLTKKFRFPIYCSKITGNLVRSKLRVDEQYINPLPMDTECLVNGVKVVLLEANHCPGAVLFLFCLPNGTSVLHTGDFRAHPSMECFPALISRKIHTLYLDTTYCSPEYTFPSQEEAVQFAVNIAFEAVTLHPRTLVVCGTYSVGKEKVFLAIAEVLGCKVSMSQDKYKTLQCLESERVQSLITTDWNSTGLHVLPMMQINVKGLLNHLIKFSRYDRILAFKPTGWTYSDRFKSVADIRPEIRGNITVYGIPYSEHSSYLEMKRFVQWLRPQKIIPTVGVGSWKSRSTMENYFREWLTEPPHTC